MLPGGDQFLSQLLVVRPLGRGERLDVAIKFALRRHRLPCRIRCPARCLRLNPTRSAGQQ